MVSATSKPPTMEQLAKQLAERKMQDAIDAIFTPKDFSYEPIDTSIDNLGSAVDIAAFKQEYSFDGSLYCNITGQHYGTMSDQMINLIIKTKSRIPTLDRLRYGQMGCRAFHWQDTANLNELALSDPYGYYVYAASFALALGQNNRTTASKDALAQQWTLHVAKREMHQALLSIPSDLVMQANAAWRDFLAFVTPSRIQHAIIWPQTGAEFASFEFVSTLGKCLREIMLSLIMKDVGNEMGFAIHAIERLKHKYGGFANFRASARIHGETESEWFYRNLRCLDVEHSEPRIAATDTGTRRGETAKRKIDTRYQTMTNVVTKDAPISLKIVDNKTQADENETPKQQMSLMDILAMGKKS